MSYKDRKKASWGSERTLYCPTCMCETEVYSGAGHKPKQFNLHCVECTNFVTRLIENPEGKLELDPTVYGGKSHK